ncbi:MAG: hypothetical protein Kow0083_10220 [Methylophaga sp.]|jgi:Domain of unknown function (DUF4390)
MPACNAIRRWPRLLALILLCHGSIAHATTVFSVNNPRIDQIGNGYVLNAQIDYPLTPRVIEALHNGVPITFFQELKLIESLPVLGRFWQWETTLWQARLHYELRYHALSEQYVLKSLETDDQQNFPRLEGALKALGTIQNLSLPPEYTQQVDHLLLLIRSGLDLSALPTPMRPGAMISSKWQLTSPWVRAVWP